VPSHSASPFAFLQASLSPGSVVASMTINLGDAATLSDVENVEVKHNLPSVTNAITLLNRPTLTMVQVALSKYSNDQVETLLFRGLSTTMKVKSTFFICCIFQTLCLHLKS